MARRAISIAFPPVISAVIPAVIPAAGPTAIAATLATGRPRRLTPAAIQAWARPHGLRPSALALAAFATASLSAGGALLPARSAQAQTAAAITTATQATTPATRHYNLPAGPLGASLAAFAGQAGLLLSFDPALTQGRQAPALQGRHSPQSGLTALLAGSGLQAEQQADGSFTLRRAPAPRTRRRRQRANPARRHRAGRARNGHRPRHRLRSAPQRHGHQDRYAALGDAAVRQRHGAR